MSRASKSGVRGLFRDADGAWRIDLRWREPGTGEARRYREGLPMGTRAAEAKTRALAVMNAAIAGGFDPKREKGKRLKEALEEYITWRRDNNRAEVDKQEASAKRLLASLGDIELGAVSPFAVERFKRDRQAGEKGAGPATVNRDLAVLSHFFGMASGWGWVDKVHALAVREVPHLKEPPGRVRHLSTAEEGALLAELKPAMVRIVITACLTGMRQGEIITLRKDAVDLDGRRVTLLKTKNNKVRHIPIGLPATEVLKEAIAASPGEFVFSSRLGTPYTPNGVRSVFRAACERADLEDLRFHDLRHTLATRLRKGGAGLDVLAKILGHSSLAMVMRYAHLEEDTVRSAMDSLAAPRTKLHAV